MRSNAFRSSGIAVKQFTEASDGAIMGRWWIAVGLCAATHMAETLRISSAFAANDGDKYRSPGCENVTAAFNLSASSDAQVCDVLRRRMDALRALPRGKVCWVKGDYTNYQRYTAVDFKPGSSNANFLKKCNITITSQ